MKKILFIVLIVLFWALPALAQTPTPSPTPAPSSAPTVSDLQTVFGSFNIGTDLVYLPRARQWEVGGGANLVTWKNLLNLRFQVAQGATGSPFFGGGINVNLVSLANLTGTNIQLSGVMKALNPAIGIMPGYNSTPGAKRFDYAVVLSVIGVTF
jgi:hypothetical protein